MGGNKVSRKMYFYYWEARIVMAHPIVSSVLMHFLLGEIAAGLKLEEGENQMTKSDLQLLYRDNPTFAGNKSSVLRGSIKKSNPLSWRLYGTQCVEFSLSHNRYFLSSTLH